MADKKKKEEKEAKEAFEHPSHKRACLCRPLNIPRTKPTNDVMTPFPTYAKLISLHLFRCTPS